MTVQEFKDYILKFMTADEALIKLLEGPLGQYEKLKFDPSGEPVHPIIIMTMAAMELGWNLSIEKDPEEVHGLTCGDEGYFARMFPEEKLN